jgi:hypothetical protein
VPALTATIIERGPNALPVRHGRSQCAPLETTLPQAPGLSYAAHRLAQTLTDNDRLTSPCRDEGHPAETIRLDHHRGFRLMSPSVNRTMGRIVAKAWSDRAFADRVVNDPPRALHELEIAIPQSTRIVAVENTNDLIFLVLSAPPVAMPLSPLSEIRDFGEIYRDPRLWPLNWLARDPVAANRMVMNPVRELANLGIDVPETLDVSVLTNRADMVHLILPTLPDDTADRTGILDLISSGYISSSLRFGRLLGNSPYAGLNQRAVLRDHADD